MASGDSAEQFFAAVAEVLLAEPGAEEGTGFGTNPGVKVGGKIVAMLVGGRLVVKLPAERCQELVAAGEAEFLSMGARTMREWVAFEPGRGRLGGARARVAGVRPALTPPVHPPRHLASLPH